ncbi:hypothetical protein AB1Y20_010011 [Prymnesium parvum]|uniref:Alpha-L-arabinofuranosidase B catalytic domain-containing protein n=1 Tax=Prymnesium parvum TaxID=97485 RepID=A0AB34K366_PRYPA
MPSLLHWLAIALLLPASSALPHRADERPCDIFARGGTPCVAAHSMTRALYAAYAGPLYKVVTSDNRSKDILVLSAGGLADSASQDAFCGKQLCVVHRIYDQSPMQNHLSIEAGASDLTPPRNAQDRGVNFTDSRSRIVLGGHPVFAAVFTGNGLDGSQYIGQGYSNRTARGTAIGDQPQSIYAVISGRHYNSGCCFDYGNAENGTRTVHSPFVDGAMEAVYFGSAYPPNGTGDGPWVGADLENGIYESSTSRAEQPPLPLIDFRAAIVKGNSGNHFSIKSGDAQKPSSLVTLYDGQRPQGYEVMKKGGAIVLGIGGDNSPWGAGTFYEGAMTAGYTSDETDAEVMANIVSAGYGQHALVEAVYREF